MLSIVSYIAIVGVIYGMENTKTFITSHSKLCIYKPFNNTYSCPQNAERTTRLADVDNRRKGMMRCTSPPGLLRYKYKGLVLSTLSRYSMVARIWLPNSSSMYWPMKIMRSRYCMQHFVGVSTTTINPPKSDAGPLANINSKVKMLLTNTFQISTHCHPPSCGVR